MSPAEELLESFLPYAPIVGCVLGFFGFTVGLPLLWQWLAAPAHVRNMAGKHVFITGGSEGLGKSMAKEFVLKGAVVTIAARREKKLLQACKEIREACGITKKKEKGKGQIGFVCMDTTDEELVAEAVAEAEENTGLPISFLVANAGKSVPGYFLDQDISVFKSTMDLNYLGTVKVVKEVVGNMVDRGEGGSVTLVASPCSIIGFLGYSSYAPSKFALRGLGDCLRNELVGFNINIHIAYPPDTDTPGFEEENKTKPQENKDIANDPTYSPDVVARGLISGIQRGLYHLPNPHPIQTCLIWLQAGATPRTFFFLDMLLAPLSTLLIRLFAFQADWIARGYGLRVTQERQQEGRKKKSRKTGKRKKSM